MEKYRFRPDNHEIEMLSGHSQYGHTFDNWGHHICTDNSDHLYHEVIAARYLQHNPNLLVEDASDYIPDHGNNCEVYPITINPENQLLTGGALLLLPVVLHGTRAVYSLTVLTTSPLLQNL
jgi:hypothetical protein